jgi:hypothetical protein
VTEKNGSNRILFFRATFWKEVFLGYRHESEITNPTQRLPLRAMNSATYERLLAVALPQSQRLTLNGRK